jgi:hypothetical protein
MAINYGMVGRVFVYQQRQEILPTPQRADQLWYLTVLLSYLGFSPRV